MTELSEAPRVDTAELFLVTFRETGEMASRRLSLSMACGSVGSGITMDRLTLLGWLERAVRPLGLLLIAPLDAFWRSLPAAHHAG